MEQLNERVYILAAVNSPQRTIELIDKRNLLQGHASLEMHGENLPSRREGLY